MLLPLKAISIISAVGQPFHDAAADAALFQAIRQHIAPGVKLVEMAVEVNDPVFATACATELLTNMGQV